MNQKKIKIVAYSDYICPFCYIGYFRIQKLKDKYDIEVEWKPFEIHPETPSQGATAEELPFPKEYLKQVFENVRKLAAEDGLDLKFSGIMPNSRLSLFISEYARKNGKFDEFHKLVLDSYWIEGKDIGDKELLLNLAESIGLNKNEISDYLNTDEPLEKIREALFELRSYGINGVPTFIIANKRMVVGAQPYETFEAVLNQIIAET
jgi:predicted DsbA family dithiol-disulfide isomerase